MIELPKLYQRFENYVREHDSPRFRAACGAIVLSPLFTLAAACGKYDTGVDPSPDSHSPKPSTIEVCVVHDPHATDEDNDTGKIIDVSTSEAEHGRAKGDYADADNILCASSEMLVTVCTVRGSNSGDVVTVTREDAATDAKRKQPRYSTNIEDCR